MKLYVLDEREIWHRPLIAAALERGFDAKRIRRGDEVEGPGFGFIRCHADPEVLPLNLRDDEIMRSRLSMIQDRAQVEVYERKSEQYRRWGEFMPLSWLFHSKAEALEFIEEWSGPIVSKAEEGASSTNVRILHGFVEQVQHIEKIFTKGIVVDHGSGGKGGRPCRSLQKDYAFLQTWIPHSVTWRVNIIGRSWAIFRRFNYPGRGVAQTGNVEPVLKLTPETESLLAFAAELREALDTRWCAFDILWDRDRWRLIETSLAWPWPSPGDCMSAPFFGSASERVWMHMLGFTARRNPSRNILVRAWRWAKPIRLGVNMLSCALLLCAWGVRPRETISGFFGRRAAYGSRFGERIARAIDALHPEERNHCAETFECEEAMRRALYP